MTSTNSTQWSDVDILQLRALPRITSQHFVQALESASCFDEYTAGPLFHAVYHKKQEVLFEKLELRKLREDSCVQFERCLRARVGIVSIAHPTYPVLLRQIPYPPIVLFVRGDLCTSDALSLSIVGTRQCTQYGQLVTERFARECSQSGLIITSGLAAGIDSIAHKATVDAGGVTYAVIACGIDTIAPSYAARLAQSISESGGAVLSEYACGVRALPPYFPQRNRIISGISKSLLVVESGRRGGSLITAQFAVDQSRDVFAIPGQITAERSMGTNALIANSIAAAALSPQQILEDYGIQTGIQMMETSTRKLEFSSALEESIYSCIHYEPLHIDSIAERFAISTPEILVSLLTLEFKGYVRQLPGRMFLRA